MDHNIAPRPVRLRIDWVAEGRPATYPWRCDWPIESDAFPESEPGYGRTPEEAYKDFLSRNPIELRPLECWVCGCYQPHRGRQ